MALKQVEYRDKDGRSWLRGLPEKEPDGNAKDGIPLGPPSMKELGLPKDVEVRLHNELFARRILTERDARSRTGEVKAAISAAFRVNVNRILAVYEGPGNEPEPSLEPVATESGG